jgi:YidC/Oxa1 family membrane protein insertase
MEFLTVPFTNALVFIYDILGNNFGLAIIVFTILARLITYPISAQQMKSAKSTQEMQNHPRMKEIQRKYKDDKQKLQMEQAKLMQELGINPLASCLPLILQIVLFIAIYGAVNRTLAATPLQLLELGRSIALPNASELIPLNSRFLWMDLGQPERLYLDFLPFGIPVLTILVMISSYFQGKVMAPTSTNPNDQGAQMARSMNLTMPLMMGYFSLLFSAGVAIYFFTSNMFGIAQYYLMRRPKAAAATAVVSGSSTPPSSQNKPN